VTHREIRNRRCAGFARTAELARTLTTQGHPVSALTVGRLLHAARYSLQSNRKIREGTSHPDRNAQFEHLNLQAQAFQQRGQPTISVDMKKTELIGEFRASGREGQPCGKPIEVLIHDLVDKNLGKLSYCGVCDLTENQGWVGRLDRS
jgi:hypothetical protein